MSRILTACRLFQNTFLLSPTAFTSLHRTASAADILELFIVQRHREELEYVFVLFFYVAERPGVDTRSLATVKKASHQRPQSTPVKVLTSCPVF